MTQLVKQSFGIDISKLDFTVCLSKRSLEGSLTFSEVEVFPNNKKGFNQFLKWSRKVGESNIDTLFVMEATGVYYESLAYHLHKLNRQVCVVLPNKVKHYAKSLNIKTKTDSVDAKIIARLGVERSLPLWVPPLPIFRELRELTRLYTDLKKERTVFLNRQECINSKESASPFIIKVNKQIISSLEKQIAKCEDEIKATIASESWLAQKVAKLETIKGVGLITIAIIIAETQGFVLITNRKQLASYAGYDIVQRESGTSVKGKTRISKKGNSRIRAALHFPALVASRHNDELKEDFVRIIQNKPSKMVGITALQRKILLLIYALWKKDEEYRQDKVVTSGNHETESLLRLDEVQKNIGNPYGLPTQDKLPSKQSTEVLLHQLQNN
jgi:transposase